MRKESHTIEIKVSASGISSEIWGCLPSLLVVGRINIFVSWTEVLVLLVVGQREVIYLPLPDSSSIGLLILPVLGRFCVL